MMIFLLLRHHTEMNIQNHRHAQNLYFHCFVESWITGLLRIFFAYSVAFCASLSAASSLALIFLKFAQPDNKKEDINKQSNFLFMFNYLMEYAKYYLLVARIIQIRLFYRDYQGLD